MGRLEAILEEAQSDLSLDNTTILDTDQFQPIRGPSVRTFRDRLDAVLAGSGDLAQVHRLNAEEGLEVIEPVRAGIHGGAWYLRSVTHDTEAFPAGEQHYKSIAEALDAAIDWWQTEPWCREIMVRKYDLKHANGMP